MARAARIAVAELPVMAVWTAAVVKRLAPEVEVEDVVVAEVVAEEGVAVVEGVAAVAAEEAEDAAVVEVAEEVAEADDRCNCCIY